MQITIEVPDRLGEQLQQLGVRVASPVKNRLSEALDHIASDVTDRAFQELTTR
jgi:predicted transcriptional regulator